MSTRTTYSHSIANDDDLLFNFFIKFSRFEYALKKTGYVKLGSHGSATPDWDRFARDLGEKLELINDPAFADSKAFLIGNPPQKQTFASPNGMTWEPNERRSKETDASYLLRLVRDVRNNLFHGGKYPESSGGPISDTTIRNAMLLRACLSLLDQCLALDSGVGEAFRAEY